MKSPRSVSLTVLASVALVILAVPPAAAHTSLIDVQPGDGDTVQEGTTVTLTFSEALLDLGTEISVTDASGEPVSLDVQRPEPPSVAATLPALAAGPVTVSWRVVARDGHPIEGMLTYVGEGAAPSATDSSTPIESDSDSANPAMLDADENDASNSGMSLAVWVAIGAAIFSAAFVGVVTKKRR